MINELAEMAEQILKQKMSDPALAERMNEAMQGQSPEYMLISPITHSLQDLDLLRLLQGDAFHGTRVPRFPLLPVQRSLFLYGGPVAYNSGFSKNRAIILTFEEDEAQSLIYESVRNLVRHPSAFGIPIVCLRVDYRNGTIQVAEHSGPRDGIVEDEMLSRAKKPKELDRAVLTTVCSDSRVSPPPTTTGLPMAIQSLGGHIPAYTAKKDETWQLDSFFKRWLDETSQNPRILIFAHGSFDCDGPACGAGKACMTAENIRNPILGKVIRRLARDASALEDKLPENPEKRVQSLAEATRRNLFTYPSLRERFD
ncbi:hypothetical protein EU538_10350, partial [Candidatus Thorarchaeota archaeon]